VLQPGVGTGLPLPHLSSQRRWIHRCWLDKVEEEKTIEGASVLKHGANENAKKEFSAVICVVY